jgi:YHS domain-containing protein
LDTGSESALDAVDEVGCQPHEHAFPKPEKELAMSELKTFTKDPTCGMEVDEATALQSVRDGKTYYFCSDQCQQTFQTISAGESKTCCG